MDQHAIQFFVEELAQLRPDVSVAFWGQLLVTVSEPSSSWNRGLWSDGNSVVFTLPNVWDEFIVPGKKIQERMFHVGRLGRIEVGFSGPSVVISVEDEKRFPPSQFHFHKSESYIEVYSTMHIDMCRNWLKDRLGPNELPLKFKGKIGSLPFELSFCAPTCTTCLGMHDDHECPFVDAISFDSDVDMTAVDVEMASVDERITPVDAQSSAKNMLLEAVKMMFASAPRLERIDLVDKIIAHVLREHFLLVGFPSLFHHVTDN